MRHTVSRLPFEGLFGHSTRKSFICTRCQRYAIRPPSSRHQSNKPSLRQVGKNSKDTLKDTLKENAALDKETLRKFEEAKEAINAGDTSIARKLIEERWQGINNLKSKMKKRVDESFEQVTQASDTGNLGGYVPAKTWDGLERLGGPRGWWEAEWDLENQFKGFMPPTKIDDVAIDGAVRRAMIEVLTLKEVDLPLTQATKAWEHTTFDYGQVELDCEHGRPVLRFEDNAVRTELLETMSKEPDSETNEEATMEDFTAEELLQDLDKLADSEVVEEDSIQIGGTVSLQAATWHQISLKDDLELKFAVFKRVMQLTGARIPDPVMQQINTAGDLVEHLLTKPKPTKLAEILLAKPELVSLPNVEIYEARRTPIDKEKELGRWKVIEKELRKRELPVTGHAHGERL